MLDSMKYALPLFCGILVQDDDKISQIKCSEYKQKIFAITWSSDHLKFIIYLMTSKTLLLTSKNLQYFVNSTADLMEEIIFHFWNLLNFI